MIRYFLLVLLCYEFSVILIDSRISGEETWHATLRREEAEDHKYPEPVRKKRQIARQSFQQYLANMGRADYDVREEEGRFRQVTTQNGDLQAGRIFSIRLGFGCVMKS